MSDEIFDEETMERDEVTGKARNKMELLNRRKVSKYELDELFCDF